MKRLNIISIITAAIAFCFASCADKAEEFKKGALDADGCYGVYFPAQNTVLVLDPAEPTFDTILVARTKTEGAITVPYTIKDENDVFHATELKFEDGQTESFIVISFDSAKVGITYLCSIVIEDPAYASRYTSNAIAIDIKVSRDKWVSLGNATFTENFFGVEYLCEILQNEKDHNKYRLMHPYDSLIITGVCEALGVPGAKNDKQSEYLYFQVLTPGDKIGEGDDAIEITADDEELNLVYFDVTQIGWHYDDGTYAGDMRLVHPYNLGADETEDFKYTKVVQFQDDEETPAGVQLAPYYLVQIKGTSLIGWDNTVDDEVIVITFPGAVLVDYSLELEEDYSNNGVQSVLFELGRDVEYVKFATFEGALNKTKIEEKYDYIIADTANLDTAIVTIDSTCVIDLSFPKTGKYTLVAVAFGGDSIAEPMTKESLILSYVAAADSVPVDIYVEFVSTKKYERTDSLSSDNCLEYTILGTDLTDLKMGLFKTEKYAPSQAKYIKAMKKDEKGQYTLSKKDLDVINETGVTDVFKKLNPGTSYTLVLIATNGYEEKILEFTASTTGDPLPLFMEFDPSDIVDALCPDTAGGFNGSYDFLAVKASSKTGDREKISSFDLKAINDTTVLATGMFGKDAQKCFLHDSVYFGFDSGVLWTIPSVMLGDSASHVAAAMNCYASSIDYGLPWDMDGLMIGGFIDEDHIAFVDIYTGSGMIDGWNLVEYEDSACTTDVDLIETYLMPMFSTKGQYDKILSSYAGTPSYLNKLAAALRAPRTNYVETELGYIKSTIRRFRDSQAVYSCGTRAGYAIVPEIKSQPVAVKVVGVKAYEKSNRASLGRRDGKFRF